MARCDEGYLCDVCGLEVSAIRESDLYLRFVTGQISSAELLGHPERHLKCNPIVAQFIDDARFTSIVVDGPFSKAELDDEYVAQQCKLMTRGWKRLQELSAIAADTPLAEYPLPEFRR